MITVALPNSVEWFVAFAACWKIGAIPQPVSAKLPARELEAILELADPVRGDRRAARAGRRDVGRCPPGTGPIPACPTTRSPMSPPRPGRHRPPVGRRAGRSSSSRAILHSTTRTRRRSSAWPTGAWSFPPRSTTTVRSCGPARPGWREATSSCFPVSTPRPRWQAIDRYASRHRVPGAHDDEADLAAARGRPRLLRPVVAAVRLAPGRALPAMAEAGVDRLARGRSGSSSSTPAPRRRRPPSSPAPSGSPTVVRSAGRSPGTVMICDADGNELPAGQEGEVWMRTARDAADLPLHRRHGADAVRADGSRSVTWDGSMRTAICIWATGWRT